MTNDFVFSFSIVDDLILRNLLSKQITHLSIDITKTAEKCSIDAAKIFSSILSLCKRLIVFNFCDIFPTRKCWAILFHLPTPSYMSSTLVKLKINVTSFFDCLYLLDGHFDSLSTLIINVADIYNPVIDLGRSVSINSMIISRHGCIKLNRMPMVDLCYFF